MTWRFTTITAVLLVAGTATARSEEAGPSGAAVGIAEGAAQMCEGLTATPEVTAIQNRWLVANEKSRRDFVLQRDVNKSLFRCDDIPPGIGCREGNLNRCGKAIQTVGPHGFFRAGLVEVHASSPYYRNMPPPQPKEDANAAANTPPSEPKRPVEGPEDSLLLNTIYSVFENPSDFTHGVAIFTGAGHSEITVNYTVYKPATPSQIIRAAADAALKIGDAVIARKLALKDRKVRIKLAIQAAPSDIFINTFIAAWSAVEVLKAVQSKAGAKSLVRIVKLEEIYGTYWPALCSNLPPPELFTVGGDQPEHPEDVENFHKRDLGCKRRVGDEIVVGRR